MGQPLTLAEIMERVAADQPPDERQRLVEAFGRVLKPHVTKQSGLMLAHAIAYQLLGVVGNSSINTLTREEKREIAGYLIDNVGCQFREIENLLERFCDEAYEYTVAKAAEDQGRCIEQRGRQEAIYKQLGIAFGKIGLMLSGAWKKGSNE